MKKTNTYLISGLVEFTTEIRANNLNEALLKFNSVAAKEGKYENLRSLPKKGTELGYISGQVKARAYIRKEGGGVKVEEKNAIIGKEVIEIQDGLKTMLGYFGFLLVSAFFLTPVLLYILFPKDVFDEIVAGVHLSVWQLLVLFVAAYFMVKYFRITNKKITNPTK